MILGRDRTGKPPPNPSGPGGASTGTGPSLGSGSHTGFRGHGSTTGGTTEGGGVVCTANNTGPQSPPALFMGVEQVCCCNHDTNPDGPPLCYWQTAAVHSEDDICQPK